VNEQGWFSDVDPDQSGDFIWQPCVQLGGSFCPCIPAWFATKADCDEFIRDEVLGQTWHPTADAQ
jgi:hypothetical protein